MISDERLNEIQVVIAKESANGYLRETRAALIAIANELVAEVEHLKFCIEVLRPPQQHVQFASATTMPGEERVTP